MGQGEHVSETNVLPSPDILNKGFIVNACGEGSDDARVRDILEFILTLSDAPYVITETLTDLAFTS
jgi:hypothetical protein